MRVFKVISFFRKRPGMTANRPSGTCLATSRITCSPDTPNFLENWSQSPPSSVHSGVTTGPGETVLTRIFAAATLIASDFEGEGMKWLNATR
jgi:hypothetical protein